MLGEGLVNVPLGRTKLEGILSTKLGVDSAHRRGKQNTPH